MSGLRRKILPATLLLPGLFACAGPGFQTEALYRESRPGELQLHTTDPREAQQLSSVHSRRVGARIAIGGPEFSARGYAQLYGETLELHTSSGRGDFDNVGVGLGALGRQQISHGEPDEVVWILPYRIGLNYSRGNGSGLATPTGTFGDLEYFEWALDLGVGISLYHFDLVAGGALRRFDGKAEVRDGEELYRDGLRGTNFGPYLSLAYDIPELPWKLEARAGFGDLEEVRFTAGLFY